MTRALHIILTACIVVITVCIVLFIRDLDREVNAVGPKLTQTITDLDRTSIIIAGTATNIEKASREWKTQSVAQSQEATKATQVLNSDLQNLGTLLLTANSTLEKQSDSWDALEKQVGESLNLTTPILNDLGTASAAMAQKTPAILDNLSQTSANSATMSANLAGGTAELQASAHDMRQVADAFRSDYLRPKNRLWFYIKTLTGLGSAAGSISQLAH